MTQLLTEVFAVVAAEREGDLRDGFAELLTKPTPDGLLRTELLRSADGWRIQSLWRDREALDAMRASGEPPAAPALFTSVGAEPSLRIMEVVQQHESGAGPPVTGPEA